MPAVLIPLAHLEGYHVWIGNDLAGACWRDPSGWRWHIRWMPPARFIYGIAADASGAVQSIIDNHR